LHSKARSPCSPELRKADGLARPRIIPSIMLRPTSANGNENADILQGRPAHRLINSASRPESRHIPLQVPEDISRPLSDSQLQLVTSRLGQDATGTPDDPSIFEEYSDFRAPIRDRAAAKSKERPNRSSSSPQPGLVDLDLEHVGGQPDIAIVRKALKQSADFVAGQERVGMMRLDHEEQRRVTLLDLQDIIQAQRSLAIELAKGPPYNKATISKMLKSVNAENLTNAQKRWEELDETRAASENRLEEDLKQLKRTWNKVFDGALLSKRQPQGKAVRTRRMTNVEFRGSPELQNLSPPGFTKVEHFEPD